MVTPIRTSWKKEKQFIPDNVPFYQLSLETNADWDLTNKNEKAREMGTIIDPTQKGKLQIWLPHGIVSQFEHHSSIFLSSKGVLEIKYRTELELSEILNNLRDILISENGELALVIRNFHIHKNKIDELENKIARLQFNKQSLASSPSKGIGWLQKNLINALKEIDNEINEYYIQLIPLTQNRLRYHKGQKWSWRWKQFLKPAIDIS